MSLRRDEQNAMLLGVCAGLGKYLSVDVTVVRLATAISTLILGPITVVAYFIAAFVIPKEDTPTE